MKVLISTSTFGQFNNEPLQILYDAGLEVINNPYNRKITQNELISLVRGVDGVIAGLEEYNNKILSISNLKTISRCGSGVSNIDMESAEKLGIRVYNTPEGPTQSVAELTLGCCLSLIRNVPYVNKRMHEGSWDKITGNLLSGMTVLIIGYGRIGKLFSKIINEIGAKILIHDPFISKKEIPNFVKRVELMEGLKLSDIITLHNSGDTMILGESEFSIMKQGVYILNSARGGIIDEDALMDALNSGKVSGAWLDTFSEEPYYGKLSQFQQVILTPHIASYTKEGRYSMEIQASKNLILGLNI